MAAAAGAPPSSAGPPLDEIMFRMPLDEFGGALHSNTVLFYFARSPYYDPTSNNEVIFQQGLTNMNMFYLIKTREDFEGGLRSMRGRGIEFMVAQEPAETGPGMGTGVWVINKQKKRDDGEDRAPEDEMQVLETYFLVNENIYMAPSLADVLSARMATISTNIAKILPIAQEMQNWTPAVGRTYQDPAATTPASAQRPKKRKASRMDISKDGVFLPGEALARPSEPNATSTGANNKRNKKTTTAEPSVSSRLLEESLMMHERYGHEYMDLNPITGKPGEFLLASTGRIEKPSAKAGKATAVPGPLSLKNGAGPGPASSVPLLNTRADGAVDSPLGTGKSGTGNSGTTSNTKSPKTPNMPKPKRRKSKMAVTPS